MSNPDLILLHAPSVYDFRQHTILRGPISDLIPSSSIFEMYPIGFTSIAAHLEDHGYRVRIVNLAARMLQDAAFEVEPCLAGLPLPLVFGIDLHWLPHAQGALSIAAMLKRLHPTVPVLMGGFSATYFHRELISYPQVDMVMRGDSTEGAVLALMDSLRSGGDLASVPNLSWKDDQGGVHHNPFTYSPPDLGMVDLDFRRLMAAAARDRDIMSYMPFLGWLKYPIMPALSCRGCTLNCLGCGGSAYAFQKLHGRSRPAYRPPEKLAADMHLLGSVSQAPIFVLGDLRQAGREYTAAFLAAVRGLQTPVIIELFMPAPRDFLQQVADALPNFMLEISLESHDPSVRRAYGKPYPSEAMEATLRHALDVGAQRVDLFFMTGLPYQTVDLVLQSAAYAEGLLAEFGGDGRVRPFIGPMAPFVDPGSRAFEEPEQHGYRIFYHTLEEHRRALLEPSWQFTLNYETRWMTRHQIVHSTYDACLRFVEMKARHHLIDADAATSAHNALMEGKALALAIESLREEGQADALHALRPRIEQVNRIQGMEEDQELQFRRRLSMFKPLHLLLFLLKAWLRDKGRWLGQGRHLFSSS